MDPVAIINLEPNATPEEVGSWRSWFQLTERLSLRQREVLMLYAAGHQAPAIGKLLGISSNTVRIHAERIRNTLGAKTMTQAVFLYYKAASTTMAKPTTEAGKRLLARSWWDEGMRGHFSRIVNPGGPEDMRNIITAIEAEARDRTVAGDDHG